MSEPEPCRHCGNPAWLTDDEGHIHRCCITAEANDQPCESCMASRWLQSTNRLLPLAFLRPPFVR